MGNGAGGLQRQRRRVELLQPRPGSLARLQVGRGRHRRLLRRPSAPVLRDCALERGRPDPEGADVRSDERRGQPRRGREGVLLLPRRHADELVLEVPLPLSAGRVPVRRSRRHEPRSKPARAGVRAARHRRASTTIATSTSTSSTPKSAPDDVHVRITLTNRSRERGDGAPVAVAVVPQHLVDGPAEGRAARRDGGAGAVDRRRAPRPGPARVALRGRARRCCSPRTRRTRSACGASANPSPYVKDAFHDYVVHGQRQRRQPGPHRHEGGRALRARHRCRAALVSCNSDCVAPTPQRSAAARSTACSQSRIADADEFYASITPAATPPDEAMVMRQALAGMLWGKQLYCFDLDRWLDEHHVHPLRHPDASNVRNRRLVPHDQRRRDLDARHVGVPVVRVVGSRVPHGRARDGRRRRRQGPARADAPRAVPPPERAAAGLRVELQRRQPAGARLGDAGRVRDRARAARRGRRRVVEGRVPEAARELHVVDQPQGPDRAQRVRGRVPRLGQHRRVRPQRPAADRRPSRAVRRHGVDGVLLAVHARHRARALRARPGLRGHGAQVRRALPVHRRGDGPHRRQRGRALGRGGRVLLRRAPPARRQRDTAQGAVDGRAPAAVRDDDPAARGSRDSATSCWPGCGAGSRRCPSCSPPSTTPAQPGVNGRRMLAVLDETQAAPDPRPDARRGRVPEPARPAGAVSLPRAASVLARRPR